jgi:hypothetical protein
MGSEALQKSELIEITKSLSYFLIPFNDILYEWHEF